MYGFEVYYCIGCIKTENKSEGHCFNIVKRKNDYALLDYNIPVTMFNKDGEVKGYASFIGLLSNEGFKSFIEIGETKKFNDYEYIENKRKVFDSTRKYVNGKFEINLEDDLNEEFPTRMNR